MPATITSTANRSIIPAPPRLSLQGLLRATCLSVIVLSGCSEANRYIEPPPPEVTVVKPTRRDVTHYLEGTGTSQPVMSIDIRARVKGFLKERHFQEGSLVKAGQLLLVIDEEPFRLALDQAKMRLAEAEVALRKARQSRARQVARAQLAVDESQLNLARTAETRQRRLTSRGVGTREELDQAVANLQKNAAQVEATRANLEQVEADHDTNILAAEASVGSARTAVRNAELELGYCRMYAPIDGRISRVNYHAGNLVGDGQSSLLATIVKLDPIYAYTNVSELDLLRYRSLVGRPGGSGTGEVSLPMELGLGDEQGYPHRGLADYQDPGADPGTGTIRLRGVFPNPDGAILPGLFVRVRIPAGRRKDALLVPERALGTDQLGQFLLVVGQDDIVESRPVKAGVRIEDLREVEGKIGPGDRVVVEGLLRARPKLKVRPVPEVRVDKALAIVEEPPHP
jgi:membrane fusion protein (multidrug efflux system)